MTTLHNYLKNLCNKGEISKAEFDQMRPRNAKPATTHRLPKIRKTFTNIPKFRPIVDTNGFSYYLVGKCLAQLLNPLEKIEFTLKDSSEADNCVQDIPSCLFVNRYKDVCFDVKSLFTNVPIENSIHIILTQIYNNHTISTNLKKVFTQKTHSRYMYQNSVFIQQYNLLTKRRCKHGFFAWVCYGQYYYDQTRKLNNSSSFE